MTVIFFLVCLVKCIISSYDALQSKMNSEMTTICSNRQVYIEKREIGLVNILQNSYE